MVLSLSPTRLKGLLLLGSLLVAGCGPKPETELSTLSKPGRPGQRTEQTWMVDSIVRETLRLTAPLARNLGEISVRRVTSQPGQFEYTVQVSGPDGSPQLHRLLLDDAGVWEPHAYASLLRELLADRWPTDRSAEVSDSGWNPLTVLIMPRVELLVRDDQRLTEWLTKAPLSPVAHEQAALLLGTFGLRESAGVFSDTRDVANRLTAHLAVAEAIRGRGAPSLPGKVAHLLSGLLAEASGRCETEMKALQSDAVTHPELRPWLAAAKLRNRKDWRVYANGVVPGTLLERLELFRAQAEAAGPDAACRSLMRSRFEDLPDWPRLLLQARSTTPEAGRFVALALPFEAEEAAKIFPALTNLPQQSPEYAQILNDAMASRGDGADAASVLDASLWARHIERHFCHVLRETERFLREQRGSREQAAAFREAAAAIYGRLALFPMVAIMSEEPSAQGPAVPAVRALLARSPELVTEAVWARLEKETVLAEAEVGASDGLSLEQWFWPALPAGTAYHFDVRVKELPQMAPLSRHEIERIHQLAPWQFGAAERFAKAQSPGRPPSARQFQEVMGRFAGFYRDAWQKFPETVRDHPAAFTAALNQMGELEPVMFTRLGAYYARHHREDDAATAYVQALHRGVTGPALLDSADWLATYYLARGRSEEAVTAGRLAEASGDPAGLQILARVYEGLDVCPEAEEIYRRLQDVWDDSWPLVRFLERQATKKPEYAARLQTEMARLFPQGIETNGVADTENPPVRGVAVRRASLPVQAAGLQPNDVVVSVNGRHAGSLAQYAYLRGAHAEGALDLVVYRGGQYREVQVAEVAMPPLTDFATYHQ